MRFAVPALFLACALAINSASAFAPPSAAIHSPLFFKSAPALQHSYLPNGDVTGSPKLDARPFIAINPPNLKAPKEAYKAFAAKGKANAKMSKRKILHQSIMGGAYVGFAGLLSLIVAGNLMGAAATNPGIVKMSFAALFPVNLLLIVTTGGQLFTGNSATGAAARYEGKITNRELGKSWGVSILGNIIGCGLFARAASYVGLLSGGAAALCSSMATAKCSAALGPTFVKAILCNWMVSLAVYLSGAASDMGGKLIGIWFPISTFVGIGLEHSIANLFMLPAALLIGTPGLTTASILSKNLVPVVVGNAIGGAIVVAASYSYQFGRLGKNCRKEFRAKLKAYEYRKQKEQKEREEQKKAWEAAERSYRMTIDLAKKGNQN